VLDRNGMPVDDTGGENNGPVSWGKNEVWTIFKPPQDQATLLDAYAVGVSINLTAW
jgi:hypothetical protein